jgi:phospholipase C
MKSTVLRWVVVSLFTLNLTVGTVGPLGAQPCNDADDSPTRTPIKHVVVIFQENISFDHYFGTYPVATNPVGEPEFRGKDDTPRVNNLLSAGLLSVNPNAVNPFRIDRSIPVTCDEDHNYGDEQFAFHSGLMDRFTSKLPNGSQFSCNDAKIGPNSVMGYYDGNTVTALWNYAQHFAMSDNSFGTTFGPSTPGALNLISGNTLTANLVALDADGKTAGSGSGNIAGGGSTGAVIGDPRPGLDDCVSALLGLATKSRITVTGTNLGDLLNAKRITWGWFGGGFRRTSLNPDGTAVCGAKSTNLAGTSFDYIPHHEPFMYYQQSANPHHLPPSSTQAIGHDDSAVNHQYDLQDFFAALDADNLPAVSFLKARAIEDGHAGYSDPLDEQRFLVQTINRLQQSREWGEIAVIIAYDDSDGWYDHVMGPIVHQSNVSDDQLTGPGACGQTRPNDQPGRCGYGPRMPLLVISPWAKRNYVDHRVTDQSSILRFIEDNWFLGRIGNGSTDEIAGTLDGLFDFDDSRPAPRKLILDPTTGRVVDKDDNRDRD